MATKQEPCTLGPKHKWTHVKNVVFQKLSIGPNGSRAHISYRGKYKCECGAIRYGVTRNEQIKEGGSHE